MILFDDLFIDYGGLLSFFLIIFDLTFVSVIDSCWWWSSPFVLILVSGLDVLSLLLFDHVPHLLESVENLFIILFNDLNFKVKFLLASIGLNELKFLFKTFRNSLVFIVGFEIKVIICVIIVVNCLNVLKEFSSGRFKTEDSVLSELTQFHHETFALIIDKFREWSCNRIIIINFNVIWFNGFSNVLLWSLKWSRNIFLRNFWLFVDFLVSFNIHFQRLPDFRKNIFKFLSLVRSVIQQMSDWWIFQPQF